MSLEPVDMDAVKDPITWLAWLSAPYFAYERDRTGKHPFECAPFVSREVLVELTVGGVFSTVRGHTRAHARIQTHASQSNPGAAMLILLRVPARVRVQIPLSFITSRLQGLRRPKIYPPPQDAPMFTLRDMAELVAEYLDVIPSGGGLIPHVFEATQLFSSDAKADLSVFTFDGTEYTLWLDDNLWWPLDADSTGLTYPLAANAKKLPSINLKRLVEEQHPSTFKAHDFDVVWSKANGAQVRNVIEPVCSTGSFHLNEVWSYRFRPDCSELIIEWTYPEHTVLLVEPNKAPTLCETHGPRHGFLSSVIVERYDLCLPQKKMPLSREAFEVVYGKPVIGDNPKCVVTKHFTLMVDEHGRRKGLEPHFIGGHQFFGTAKVAAYWVVEDEDDEEMDGRMWYCNIVLEDVPHIVSAITSKFVGRKFQTKGLKTKALNDRPAELIALPQKRVAHDRVPVMISSSDGTLREVSIKPCKLVKLE